MPRNEVGFADSGEKGNYKKVMLRNDNTHLESQLERKKREITDGRVNKLITKHYLALIIWLTERMKVGASGVLNYTFSIFFY